MIVVGCAPSKGADQSAPWLPERVNAAGLPNALRVHERVISGGEPAGESAFAELRALGVQTIISVDGARPNVELAAKYGLRYIHLPHGYDGVPAERAKELAKAVRDLPGPVYLHCHHGKHRSPAAAAVACVAAGLIQAGQALPLLKAAGTSENYRGLFLSAQSVRRIDDQVLDALMAEFPAEAKVPPIADAMVEIEHAYDHLQALADIGWQRLAQQPDLDPAHEALLLKEHYRELARTPDVQQQSVAFQSLLAESERTAQQLETALYEWQQSGGSSAAKARSDAIFAAATRNCTTCHRQFRDVPLGEKRR
jgi:protein tyrosine phosphatase (PTP) superfamily phosphohydrolase (DUF442 family)